MGSGIFLAPYCYFPGIEGESELGSDLSQFVFGLDFLELTKNLLSVSLMLFRYNKYCADIRNKI